MKREGRFVFGIGVTLLVIGLGLGLLSKHRRDEVLPNRPSNGSLVSGDPLPSIKGDLKILTWNLQWFPGQAQGANDEAARKHFESVQAVLKDADAQILCLQEIQDPEAFVRLVESLGCPVQILLSFQGAQEVGIASSLPALVVAFEEFEKSADTPPRGFVFGVFDLPEVRLLVYSVHLKSNVGGIDQNIGKREESARQLLRHIDRARTEYGVEGKPLAFVICGDLNTNPYDPDFSEERTLLILQKQGFVWTLRGLPYEEAVTWLSDGRYPDASFDHFLISAPSVLRFGRAYTIKTDRTISDHRPVIQELRLRKP